MQKRELNKATGFNLNPVALPITAIPLTPTMVSVGAPLYAIHKDCTPAAWRFVFSLLIAQLAVCLVVFLTFEQKQPGFDGFLRLLGRFSSKNRGFGSIRKNVFCNFSKRHRFLSEITWFLGKNLHFYNLFTYQK